MNRAARRRHAALRRRLIDDRIPDAQREALRARERALLAEMNGLPIPPGRCVVLLAEGLPPAPVTWDALPAALRLLNIELHPDTVALAEGHLRAGRVPAISFVDGWINCHGLPAVVMSPGGVS